MWRLCKLGYRHEPGSCCRGVRAGAAGGAARCAARVLVQAARRGRARAATGPACGSRPLALGVSAAATWFLQTVSTRVQRRFRDKVTIALESHVATLLASIATIAHQERPEYLDRLAVLRNQVFMLDHMYMSLFTTCGWILRLGVTIALLVSIHPALALLALFALPTVFTSTWRPAVERSAYERGAQASRLARHLFDIATTAAAGKEVRVTGIGDRLVKERRLAWEFGNRPIAAARWAFGRLAHRRVGDLRRRVRRRDRLRLVRTRRARRRRAADAGGRLAPLVLRRRDRRRDRLPARHLDGCREAPRLARGLRELARGSRRSARARRGWPRASASSTSRLRIREPIGSCSTTSISSCRRARSSRSSARTARASRRSSSCWRRCTSRRAAASSSIGPTSRAFSPLDWRARLAGAFQDFFRFEFRARHTVGVGDLPRLDDEPAVVTAVGRAGADDVIVRLTGRSGDAARAARGPAASR